MHKVRIWDVPTRLFHWALVGLIGFSWWSAEEHHLDWHIWSGIGVLTLLVFRILWGLFGSSTARFANFIRGPRGVIGYLRDMKGWQPVGHTPLGALSVIAMLGALLVQVGLGLFSADEDGFYQGPLAGLISIDLSDALTELHEDWFNVILVLVGLHIAALLFYRLALGKKLIRAMLTGRGAVSAEAEPMRPGKWWVALICLAVAIGFCRWIIAGAPPFGA
jgi:cytochrome b